MNKQPASENTEKATQDTSGWEQHSADKPSARIPKNPPNDK